MKSDGCEFDRPRVNGWLGRGVVAIISTTTRTLLYEYNNPRRYRREVAEGVVK